MVVTTVVGHLYRIVSFPTEILTSKFSARTLTAAHCYARISSLEIIVGAHNIKGRLLASIEKSEVQILT